MAGTARSAPDVTAFARQSSGLVRDLTLADAAWYGVFSSGGLFGFVFLFPYPQFASPGISIPLMLVLTLAFGVIVYAVYAALGSAMPRAGGDYLFQSRTLHPVVGFVVPWACQLLFWLAFPTAGAYVVSTFGLVPIADAFDWTSASTWLVTETGNFVVAAVVVVCCWALNVAGMRVYRFLQRFVLVPLTLVATATILVLLLVNLGTDFAARFDAYHAGTGITAASVAAAADAGGYRPASFSIQNTAIWVAVLAAYVPYTMYSAQGLLGEVKQASSLRRLFTAFLLPGAFVSLVMLALPFLLFTSIAGGGFIDRYAWAFGSGGIAPSYAPNFSVFLSMLSSNSLVVSLVSLGFIAGGFGIANVVFLNASRVMMAMSLDGLLPRFFAAVDARTHTPVKALSTWSVLALGVAAVFSYRPSWQATVLLGGAITSVLVVGVTCLGGALFPYQAPAIYQASPAARYRIGPLPLITVAGAIGALVVAALIGVALTVDELALTSSDSRTVIGGAFVSGIVVYDYLSIEPILDAAPYVTNAEGRVVELVPGVEMISSGYGNPTPWRCPRDVSEDELARRIEAMASALGDVRHAVFNLHVPPRGSGLDQCPRLDTSVDPPRPVIGEEIAAGSTAVREAIVRHHPALSLHGHIHESRGIQRIGPTLCINPGSEYGEGILRSAVIDLEPGREPRAQLLAA